MAWSISFSERAKADFAKFDTGERTQITKVLKRVSQNPLPKREGGYGTELGKKHGINLSGWLKIKLKKAGIRIVYTLERTEQGMNIIIIGMRADMAVYREAATRLGRLWQEIVVVEQKKHPAKMGNGRMFYGP